VAYLRHLHPRPGKGGRGWRARARTLHSGGTHPHSQAHPYDHMPTYPLAHDAEGGRAPHRMPGMEDPQEPDPHSGPQLPPWPTRGEWAPILLALVLVVLTVALALAWS